MRLLALLVSISGAPPSAGEGREPSIIMPVPTDEAVLPTNGDQGTLAGERSVEALSLTPESIDAAAADDFLRLPPPVVTGLKRTERKHKTADAGDEPRPQLKGVVVLHGERLRLGPMGRPNRGRSGTGGSDPWLIALALGLTIALSATALQLRRFRRRALTSEAHLDKLAHTESWLRHALETEQSRRRDIEAKLQALAEAVPDAILLLDEQGTLIYADHTAETILRCAADDLKGRALHDIIVPEQLRERAHRGYRAFRQSGQGPFIGRMQRLNAVRPDGSTFIAELSVSALQLDGRWHALGVLRDVSQEAPPRR